MNGSELIAAERQRQLDEEGWTPAHDDTHTGFQLAMAADSYLSLVSKPDDGVGKDGKPLPEWNWPWEIDWWKPAPDAIRNLVKAGALIAAEIDRLQRQAASKPPEAVACAQEWRCECGAAPSPTSAAWRWNGQDWEHHHGYPIGHVIAQRRPQKEAL
jgi:hypothetical protein